MTSISVIGLYLSYIIPVYLSWRARSRGNAVPRGPWHLGRFGPTVNVIAMLWVVFISVVLSIPDHQRAAKAIGALTLLLAVWYVMTERHRFRGPAWASNDAASILAPGPADEEPVSGG